MWKIHPQGVLHIGAHLGEEADDYEAFDWGAQNGIHWVEGQSQLVNTLRAKFNGTRNKVYEGVVWHTSEVPLAFNISNNSQSSSVFEFGSHSQSYPEVVFESSRSIMTVTIADLLPKEVTFDFINLDIQGAELNALKGIGDRLKQVNWIYSEVNSTEVYKGCATIDDLDAYLGVHGFTRVATVWVKNAGWGDALYIRNTISNGRFSIIIKKLRIKNFLALKTFSRRLGKLLKVILD